METDQEEHRERSDSTQSHSTDRIGGNNNDHRVGVETRAMARVRMSQQANNDMIVPCDQQGINNNINRDNDITENDVLGRLVGVETRAMARLRMQQANNSMIVPCDRRIIDLSNNNSENEADSDESDESSRTRGVWDDEYNASDMEGIDPYYFFEIGVDEEHNASDFEGIDRP